MNFKELSAYLGLEEDEYREILELFMLSGGANFQKLQESLDTGNADQVMRCAHSIKGAAGNLGLEEVSMVAAIIEARALQNRLHDLGAAVLALKGHFEAIRAAARQVV